MKIKFITLLLCLSILFSSCMKELPGGETNAPEDSSVESENGNNNGGSETSQTGSEDPEDVEDLGDGNKTFGESIEDLGAYDGYFEGDSKDAVVECLSGTKNAYKLEGSTLTFTKISADSVYSISGKFKGNIVIDVGDDFKFDLEMHGFSLVSTSINPITVKSGDEVAIKAKKDTANYIYDMRSAIDSSNEELFSGAVHSQVDLEIGGKGKLTVVSENNNGIHSKDDLQVKNLTLFVACIDNSLKGNDGVEIENAVTTLISSGGDCIKTENSDISEKGNQRGSVTITGGTHNLYAACDGIDAAYNVTVNDASTVLNVYTDKYSNYSGEVSDTSSDTNYIRFTSDKYYYSVKYYNSDTDFVWVNAEYHSKVSGGRSTYYYYSYPKMHDYAKQQFFIYEKESQRGGETEYLVKSDYLTPNSGSDTFAITQSYNGLSYQWTNYSTKVQDSGFGGGGPGGGGPGGGGPGGGGPGGMGDGNSNKGDHSTKGIKASNEIIINAGTINIKAYDDAIHANKDNALENGQSPLGNVTVNGGVINVYSNDDGLHADGKLLIKAGTVTVANSYEGLEGTQVEISGGNVSIRSDDDGINGTISSGTAIAISGGKVYIYCTGDGIDSNSRTADQGIVFSGGNTVVISNSGMNSAIDSENGYTYTAGSVIAIMPRGGMSNEATHCDNFSKIGKSVQISISSGDHLVVGIKNVSATVRMPVSLSALVIVLGDSAASVSTESATSEALDENGVCWN